MVAFEALTTFYSSNTFSFCNTDVQAKKFLTTDIYNLGVQPRGYIQKARILVKCEHLALPYRQWNPPLRSVEDIQSSIHDLLDLVTKQELQVEMRLMTRLQNSPFDLSPSYFRDELYFMSMLEAVRCPVYRSMHEGAGVVVRHFDRRYYHEARDITWILEESAQAWEQVCSGLPISASSSTVLINMDRNRSGCMTLIIIYNSRCVDFLLIISITRSWGNDGVWVQHGILSAHFLPIDQKCVPSVGICCLTVSRRK
jgi:hypothetical protein